MESVPLVENINNKNVEIQNEFDSCQDDKVCVYETVISGGCIKQEPYDAGHESGNTRSYTGIEDDKLCVYETVIKGGYVKQALGDSGDEPGRINNNINIKEEITEDPTVVQETICMTNIKGNYLICCEGCGEEYNLYCLKCPMLIRIFDGNNSDLSDNDVMWTLPKNFVDISQTQSGVGVIALRVIPKGVMFGPFVGLDDDALSKWISRNKELVYAKDLNCLNWMQYIRRVDQCAHPNLIPFQYEDGLYYRSDCHISAGDELLVSWDSDRGESMPWICESLDNVYACMLCCVGYKSRSHLTAHNSRCPQKRDQNDFCKEIIRCAFCKIYMDEKEYSGYHVGRCIEKFIKISALHQGKKRGQRKNFDDRHLPYHEDVKHFACTQRSYKTTTEQQPKLHDAIHNDDKPFECSLCSYKTKTNSLLKLHLSTHNEDKPFECSLCSFKTKTNTRLKEHIARHNDDKLFGCKQCPFKTKTNRQLKRHVVTHKDDRPFACFLCSYKARSNSELKTHLAVHDDDKPFACIQCPFKTKTNKRLKLHAGVHSDDKPHACSFCSFKTTTNARLKAHIVKHNDDKPFACSLCSYKTTINWRLKRHIVTHNDDKLFSCNLCSYNTKRYSQLELHVAVHNDDKSFACTQCPYITKTNSQLKLHIVKHGEDKPFACSICSYKTRAMSYLKKHMATHGTRDTFRVRPLFIQNEHLSRTEGTHRHSPGR